VRGAGPRPARSLACAAVAAAALALAPGCAAPPASGPVARPARYPDRTSLDATWRTFLWAWRSGDVAVLRQVYGWVMRDELEQQLARNGPEAVAAWYRSGAEGLTVAEAEWVKRSEAHAYLRAVFTSAARVEPIESLFSFVRRPDGWIVTAQKEPVR